MSIFHHGSQSYVDTRHAMVEQQLMARGIHDSKVLDAMAEVPREYFVPPEYRRSAYDDGPLPIGEGQTISQPYMVAVMTECLSLHKQSRVLEIGTGSGYQMAVLLTITPHVYSIERIPALTEKARNTLTDIGFKDLHIKTDDGSCGWPEEAPFDGIIVTSGAPEVPQTLKDQLADGGSLVIPVGSRHTQVLYKILRRGNLFTIQEITCCVFVPLVGKYAWDEKSLNRLI